ncbi:hypothetical protein HALO113_161059 [Halomonas sp. 113]|nr:hypothetical protein HALO113_161059 [Halomonas sp. 113]CAD5281081.1 hypothetical protein HALOI3_220027 [Halomonas sp. I3]VXC61157.1 hypothetical protein HALO153_350226 [Halomonas titanicae]
MPFLHSSKRCVVTQLMPFWHNLFLSKNMILLFLFIFFSFLACLLQSTD